MSVKSSCEPSNNPCEPLWNQARISYESFGKTTDKKERIDHLLEGQKKALQAVELNGDDFESLRWAAVTTGQLTDFLGTKEKIEQGGKFKEYLDRALAINGREYSLLHMRARYAFSVAGLSWLERKAAAVLYSTPPTATYEEALSDFLNAYKERPDWIENLVYIARCYLELKNKTDAKRYLTEAVAIQPADESEKLLLEEARKLLNKC